MFVCEKFVKEYMPVVRAFMVRELYETYKLSQVEISTILDITQPAVSQYIRGYRGDPKKLDDTSIEIIKEKTKAISEKYTSGELTTKYVWNSYCSVCKALINEPCGEDC